MLAEFTQVQKQFVRTFAKSDITQGWELITDHSKAVKKIVRKKLTSIINTLEKEKCGVLVAIGGFGRDELTPLSDLDLAYIEIEQTPKTVTKLLENLATILTEDFGKHHQNTIIQRSIGNLQSLEPRDWNSLTDIAPLYESALFDIAVRELRGAYNSRSRIAQVAGSWKKRQEIPVANSLEFNIKEDAGGIRDLQIALWMATTSKFASPKDHYPKLPKDIYDALGILHFARCYAHLTENSDTLTPKGFKRFQKRYGDGGLATLLEARRKTKSFAQGFRHKLIENGIEVGDGISYTQAGLKPKNREPRQILNILSLSQEGGLDIDQSLAQESFADFQPTAQYKSLFGSVGLLYDTLRKIEFLGFADQLVQTPRLARSIKDSQTLLYRAFERIQHAQELCEEQTPAHNEIWSSLSQGQLIGYNLALLGQEMTPTEKNNLSTFYELTGDAKRVFNLLTENGRMLIHSARNDVNNVETVAGIQAKLEEDSDLDILVAYTLSFRKELNENQPVQSSILELHRKIREPCSDISNPENWYGDVCGEIYKKLPLQLKTSQFKGDIPKTLKDLEGFLNDNSPRVSIYRIQGTSVTYRVITLDQPGVVSTIAGQTFTDTELLDFQVYSANLEKRCAIDYVTVCEPPKNFEEQLRTALIEQKRPDKKPEQILAAATGYKLYFKRRFSNKNQFALKVKARQIIPGAIYAATQILQDGLDVNIFGVRRAHVPSLDEERYLVHFETTKSEDNVREFVERLPHA
ncbi:MAG: putative nucleotidyltransferase [Candidatus Woesearchaeota archaeon]|jgi:predicted nucleotidyltransferase